MIWQKIRLGDVCEKIGSGATPKGGAAVYTKKGVSFIRSQNVYNLEFDYDGLVYINNDTANKLKNVEIKESDVLLNITGDSVARTCLVPIELLPARVNQHVSIIRPDKKVLNPIFLNYYLVSPYMQAYMLNLAVGKGTSRNAITKGMIMEFEVPCPPTEIQKKVISILKPYDDLIENNKKQIKLLEEAAERLYKEWFVGFRFPGHKDNSQRNELPEGWNEGLLGELAKNSGENVKKSNNTKYLYYLPIDCLPKKSLGYTKFNDVSIAQSSLVSFSRSDILFGSMRPYFHKVVIARDSGLTRSTCFVINAINPNYWAYLVMLLFSTDTVNYATTISVGTTMPYVRWGDFIKMPIIIPPEYVALEFDKRVKPLLEKLLRLTEQNIKLKEARDRLLPKLLSGEIEV